MFYHLLPIISICNNACFTYKPSLCIVHWRLFFFKLRYSFCPVSRKYLFIDHEWTDQRHDHPDVSDSSTDWNSICSATSFHTFHEFGPNYFLNQFSRGNSNIPSVTVVRSVNDRARIISWTNMFICSETSLPINSTKWQNDNSFVQLNLITGVGLSSEPIEARRAWAERRLPRGKERTNYGCLPPGYCLGSDRGREHKL